MIGRLIVLMIGAIAAGFVYDVTIYKRLADKLKESEKTDREHYGEPQDKLF